MTGMGVHRGIRVLTAASPLPSPLRGEGTRAVRTRLPLHEVERIGERPNVRRDRRRREGGFSLLEVMVAIAIMAISLVVIVRITSMNVRAAAHSRMVTTATFLARSKLAAVEDEIITLGFTDSDQEDAGDFGDEGRDFSKYRWESLIERVELPTDVAAQAQEAASEKTMEAQTGPSTNPLAAMSGMMGSFMGTLIEPVRVGLQESVRRVTVRVKWEELGREDQSFEVVTYMTDPSRLDLAMGLPAAGAGTAGAGGAGGTTGAGGAGGSTGTVGGGSARPAGTGSLSGGRPAGGRTP
jgi:prepilin-type N-terminal cleavage/methylation domain-containing protein